MIRRAISILSVALLLGASGAAASSTADAVVPREGHYSGHDHEWNPIGLNYSRTFQVNHFSINHRARLGGYQVSSARWHGPCHHGLCTSGQWVNPNKIQGHWWHENSPAHKVGYVVYWVNGMSGPG